MIIQQHGRCIRLEGGEAYFITKSCCLCRTFLDNKIALSQFLPFIAYLPFALQTYKQDEVFFIQ